MRVLVTGASGFVGRMTCAELRSRDHQVGALVRRPGSEPAGTRAHEGDITDAASVTRAIDSAQPDAILHLAAETAATKDAARIEQVNVEGTRNVVEASVTAGVERFVFCSTVVTGNAHGETLTEDSTLPVDTVYGRSKQKGEEIVRQSGLRHSIIRPGHVYGAGGWYEEEFVKRLQQPGRFAVVGKGDNWWDVVRVEDVAAALVLAVEKAGDGTRLPRGRRHPDHLLRLRGAHRRGARAGQAAAPAGGRGQARRRRRSGQGRRPIGQDQQRPDQARAVLGAALSERADGRPGRRQPDHRRRQHRGHLMIR